MSRPELHIQTGGDDANDELEDDYSDGESVSYSSPPRLSA